MPFNFMAAVTICSDFQLLLPEEYEARSCGLGQHQGESKTLTKIKSVTVSIVPPSICHEVMEPDAKSLVF